MYGFREQGLGMKGQAEGGIRSSKETVPGERSGAGRLCARGGPWARVDLVVDPVTGWQWFISLPRWCCGVSCECDWCRPVGSGRGVFVSPLREALAASWPCTHAAIRSPCRAPRRRVPASQAAHIPTRCAHRGARLGWKLLTRTAASAPGQRPAHLTLWQLFVSARTLSLAGS
jgi:hypothetical protein